ncbi:MAG: bacterial Transrane Pair family protein [Herbaspirillum sp.]|jgi:uncharacterized membrane protein|nr:bacterial Transrane Pair family protein [Herbaspirillum sp.]
MDTATFKRSIWERAFHAFAFEIIAIALTAAAIVLAMGKPLASASGLAVAISTIAMLWNMLFNAAFDRAQAKMGFARTVRVRVVHAFLFESGLTIAIVPLAAWWLNIGLLQAFVLDLGVLAFFLLYAFVYNWCYDIIRARVVAKYRGAAAASASSSASARIGNRPAH